MRFEVLFEEAMAEKSMVCRGARKGRWGLY
jgi:hypothetical protein